MTDETENLILEHLRGIRADIADVKRDVGRLENGQKALSEEIEEVRNAVTGSMYAFASAVGNLSIRVEKLETHGTGE